MSSLPEDRDQTSGTPDNETSQSGDAYWKANLRLLGVLFAIWFLVSFGAGILFVDLLNQISFFGFPLGFWFAQQGSILVFVLLILFYVWWMHRIDHKFGVSDDDQPDSYDVMNGGH